MSKRRERSGTKGSESLAEHLRSARPRLILRFQPAADSDRNFLMSPYIRQAESGEEDVVLSEEYDPHSPLGCPVYRRFVNRGGAQFVTCCTFLASRARVIKAWGTKGLAYCDPITGMAVAQLE